MEHNKKCKGNSQIKRKTQAVLNGLSSKTLAIWNLSYIFTLKEALPTNFCLTPTDLVSST